MNTSSSDLHTLAIRRAARRFIADLAAEAMLPATARVEALLSADAKGSPFAVDEALAFAWPPTESALPRHEVIWATGGHDDGEGLRLSAFDAAGRMLLRRSYLAGARQPGAGHV